MRQYDAMVTGSAFEARFAAGRPLANLWWTAAAAAAALAVGVAASFSVTAAVAVTVAIGAGAAVVRRPTALLWILAVSIFVELLRVQGTTISRVLAPLALVTVAVQIVRGRAAMHVGRPLVWAGAYALWALASGIWTTSLAGTTYQLLSLSIGLVYMLAFASMVESDRDLEHVLYVLGLAAVVFGVISWLAFSGKIYLAGATQGGRAQGETGDPSTFAAYELLVLPLMLVLVARAERRWLRRGLSFAVLILIGSILVSLSRGGLIALAVLLLLLVLLPARVLFRSRRSKATALLLVALGTAAVSLRYSDMLTRRVETIVGKGPQGTQRGSGRLNLWLGARTTIDEHPLFGIGYGAFPYASNDAMLRTPGVDLEGYYFRNPGQPVHNSYLEAWAELGVFGCILYVGLLASTALFLRRTALKARASGDELVARVAYALVLSLVTWFITSLFLSTETSRGFWIVFGVMLALPKLLAARSGATRVQHP
jgi:O-antigen ligase